ncbi:hypothetical protein FCM35_KLT14066 [Carex littledalei]|uniref:Uncharacterized protein n=1 Tax=Carex littledalei TaxID=544730 RepID=A0A833Q9H7_9POAL|nr:hypothetical protein FCM35_KLT14066 [Carex littledalei]
MLSVFTMEGNRARPSLDVCFGDREITLLDDFERFSVMLQLNRAILRRSFSAPSPARFAVPPTNTIHNQRFIEIDTRKKARRFHLALKWWLKFRLVFHGWTSQRKGKTVNKRQGGFNQSMRW